MIVKQLDIEGGEFVAFVELDPGGEWYSVELYARTNLARAIAYCGHNHHSQDAAERCGRQLMRRFHLQPLVGE